MLLVSLLAILVGCLFLFLEIRAYGGFGQIKGALSAVSPSLLDQTAHYWA
jgi:hypothetical protein